jgi:hypothetical protein
MDLSRGLGDVYKRQDIDSGQSHLTVDSIRHNDKLHETIYHDIDNTIIGSDIDTEINYSLIIVDKKQIKKCTWGVNIDSKNNKTELIFDSVDLPGNNNQVIYSRQGNNSIDQIASELQLTQNTIQQIALVGYKRFGDWYQALYAARYNLLLSTSDYWAEKYAILISCPIISKYTNWYDGNHLDTELSVLFCQTQTMFPDLNNPLRERKQILEYNDENKTFSELKKALKFNVNKFYNRGRAVQIEGKDTGVTIPPDIIPYIINKYLKYKMKYLKKKNPYLEINQNIENERKKLMNDKTVNYDSLYQKYIKYKNKYKKLTI